MADLRNWTVEKTSARGARIGEPARRMKKVSQRPAALVGSFMMDCRAVASTTGAANIAANAIASPAIGIAMLGPTLDCRMTQKNVAAIRSPVNAARRA